MNKALLFRIMAKDGGLFLYETLKDKIYSNNSR